MSLWTRWLCVGICLLLSLRAKAQTTQPTPPTPPAADRFIVGVCTHFSQKKGMLQENLDLVAAAGIASIRDEVTWNSVEMEKGVFSIPPRIEAYVNAALERGIEPLLVLGYGNRFYQGGRKPTEPESIEGFVRYAQFVVTHFKGRVHQYEIWNEWNIGIGTPGGEAGRPEDYIRLLEPVSQALRKIDPHLTIIGGAAAPRALGDNFFLRTLELGLTRHCDVVSIHTYNYANPKPQARTPEAWLATVQHIAELVQRHNNDQPKPLYITEHGWPTQQGPAGTPPPRAADYLARMYLLARTVPSLHGVWWYDFQDDGWQTEDAEHNFGLVRPDLTPKQAYYAIASVTNLLSHTARLQRVFTPDPHVVALRLQSATGHDRLMMWSDQGQRQLVLHPEKGGADGMEVAVHHLGRPAIRRSWQHRDWPGQPQAHPEPALALTLTSTPLLVDTKARFSIDLPATRPATGD